MQATLNFNIGKTSSLYIKFMDGCSRPGVACYYGCVNLTGKCTESGK